jgi:anti-sigma factor ChrR (cupin superfamily)
MTLDPHGEHHAELVALAACGALSDDERREFEAHLAAGCPQCESQRVELEKVAEALIRHIPSQSPPPAVRARLMVMVHERCAMLAAQKTGGLSAHALSGGDAGVCVVRSREGAWTDTQHPGVRVRTLFVDRERRQYTALVRMAPGTSYPAHAHEGAEECLVIEGDLRFAGLVLRAGDFLRTPPGYSQGVQTTEQGCLLYLTTPMS